MATLIYIGPHGAVDVLAPDGNFLPARWGDPFETTDEHAKELLAQPDNWKRAAKRAAKEES